MKSILASLTILAFACLTSCGPDQPSSSHVPAVMGSARTGDISNEQAEQPPFVGMTITQALARCGEPKTRGVTDDSENWVYILNFGEVMGRAFIPFNFKPTAVRTGTLTFGPNGRVKKFNWDVPAEG